MQRRKVSKEPIVKVQRKAKCSLVPLWGDAPPPRVSPREKVRSMVNQTLKDFAWFRRSSPVS